MKTLYSFFFLSVLIFFTILSLIYLDVKFPNWIRFYVNDFLCMPVVLTICLKAVHYLKNDNTIRLPLISILSLTTFYSVYFEWILPEFIERYTADWLDVVMYFSGAMVFYFLQQMK